MSAATVNRPAVRPHWLARSVDPALPLWLRVAAYAEAHADEHGHTQLRPEQLRLAVDPYVQAKHLSRAIARAIRLGWLDPISGARCLVLARATVHVHCPATHRRHRGEQ